MTHRSVKNHLLVHVVMTFRTQSNLGINALRHRFLGRQDFRVYQTPVRVSWSRTYQRHMPFTELMADHSESEACSWTVVILRVTERQQRRATYSLTQVGSSNFPQSSRQVSPILTSEVPPVASEAATWSILFQWSPCAHSPSSSFSKVIKP